jgi:hypothetical protein
VALAFAVFFETTKHVPRVADIAPFVEDPYDAVCSFGVQLTAFAAALAVLCAFGPAANEHDGRARPELVARAAVTALLATAVSLAADAVALARHPSASAASPARSELALGFVAMLLLTSVVGWFVLRRLGADGPRARVGLPWAAVVVPLAAVLVLYFYPEEVRASVPGALASVVVGAVCLFAPVRVLVRAAAVGTTVDVGPDVLDSAAAICHWAAARSTPIAVLGRCCDQMLARRAVRATVDWLNPRAHRWHAVVLIGVAIGLVLAGLELLAEGGTPEMSHGAMVIMVFAGLEACGVALGYALLGGPLALFRRGDVPHS